MVFLTLKTHIHAHTHCPDSVSEMIAMKARRLMLFLMSQSWLLCWHLREVKAERHGAYANCEMRSSNRKNAVLRIVLKCTIKLKWKAQTHGNINVRIMTAAVSWEPYLNINLKFWTFLQRKWEKYYAKLLMLCFPQIFSDWQPIDSTQQDAFLWTVGKTEPSSGKGTQNNDETTPEPKLAALFTFPSSSQSVSPFICTSFWILHLNWKLPLLAA